MEGLLTIFVALTAIAVFLQAGVMIAMYLVAKRTSEQLDRFTKDARELMVPVRSIADNLKTVSEDFIEVGLVLWACAVENESGLQVLFIGGKPKTLAAAPAKAGNG